MEIFFLKFTCVPSCFEGKPFAKRDLPLHVISTLSHCSKPLLLPLRIQFAGADPEVREINLLSNPRPRGSVPQSAPRRPQHARAVRSIENENVKFKITRTCMYM